MDRIRLDLEPSEYEALSRLAERDLRPVQQEARHLVREALREAGLLGAPLAEKLAPAGQATR
jgi:hypothetical protein